MEIHFFNIGKEVKTIIEYIHLVNHKISISFNKFLYLMKNTL